MAHHGHLPDVDTWDARELAPATVGRDRRRQEAVSKKWRGLTDSHGENDRGRRSQRAVPEAGSPSRRLRLVEYIDGNATTT